MTRRQVASILGLIFATCVAMVGFTIHHSVFWAMCDFVFSPLALCKWLICHQLKLSIIKSTFSFFLS